MICEKCGQPELTPQRKAFYEAAMNHAKIATDEQIMLDDIAAWYERSHDEMTLAYRALMESERGESGKIPGLYKLGSGE